MRAIVTGGTRGIGLAIANYLRKYYDVMTVGRGADNDIQCDLSIADCTIPACNILVNNAGFQYIAPAVDYGIVEWHRQMEMVYSAFSLSRQAYKQGCSRIINIASDAGIRPPNGTIGYSVAKAAMIHMTKCLSNEWGEKCTVNCICPGFIDTDMLKLGDKAEMITKLIPAKRIGNTKDIIPTIEYLLKASYVTGAVLSVDGGWINR
jgi:NAD(P)-dependent dehydrogenase (short-subunit alcohol dehydrogenase family)